MSSLGAVNSAHEDIGKLRDELQSARYQVVLWARDLVNDPHPWTLDHLREALDAEESADASWRAAGEKVAAAADAIIKANRAEVEG